MILFRNIHPVFRSWPLFVATMALSCSLAVSSPLRAEENVTQRKDDIQRSSAAPSSATRSAQSCDSKLAPSIYPLFRDLKRVVFDLEVPGPYVQAVQWHGKDKECSKTESSPDTCAKYQRYYNAFPSPLHPDNLTRLLTGKITKTLMPYVDRDETCRLPDLVSGRVHAYEMAENKDTLTIIARLTILDNTQPRIAVLSTNYYRPNPMHVNLKSAVFLNQELVIPLDLPEDTIAARLNDFINAPLTLTTVFSTDTTSVSSRHDR